MDPTKMLPAAEKAAPPAPQVDKPGAPPSAPPQLGAQDGMSRVVELLEGLCTVMGHVAKKIGVGEEEQPEAAAYAAAGDDDETKKKNSQDRVGSVPAVAAAASAGAPTIESAALRGELRSTNARLAKIETERTMDRLTNWARKELSGFALGSEAELDREIREFAAAGEPTLKAYVGAIKKRSAPRPMQAVEAGAAPAALEGTPPTPAQKDVPEVLAYAAHGPDVLQLARTAAEEYRAMGQTLRGGRTLGQFLPLQRELQGFPVTAGK